MERADPRICQCGRLGRYIQRIDENMDEYQCPINHRYYVKRGEPSLWFLTDFLTWLEGEGIELAREGRRWDTHEWDLCSVDSAEKRTLIQRYITQLHPTESDDTE